MTVGGSVEGYPRAGLFYVLFFYALFRGGISYGFGNFVQSREVSQTDWSDG